MKKPFKYEGELGTPIRVPPTLSLGLLGRTEHERQKHEAETTDWIIKERFRKLELLSDHFGVSAIDPNRWLNVLYWLAVRHVDGMQILDELKRKRGAPRKVQGRYMLVFAVDDVVREGHSISRACEILTKRKETFWSGKNPRSLESRYHEYSKENASIAKMMNAAAAAPVQMGLLYGLASTTKNED